MLFRKFLERVEVIGINGNDSIYVETVVGLRQQYHLKLPDAITAGTTAARNAILITRDQHFQPIEKITVLSF